MAWVLPAAYLVHLLEEYFTGVTLPVWLNTHLDADLSNSDFLTVNGIAMAIVLFNAVTFSVGRGRMTVMVAIITVFLVNGLLHGLGSLYWGQYSPGTITGLAIYVPLGLLALYRLWQVLRRNVWQVGLAVGLVAHAMVITIARSI